MFVHGKRKEAIHLLLFVCPDCHKWHAFISISEMLKFNHSIQPDIVPCPGGCGLMVQVQENDKIEIVKGAVRHEMPAY